MNNKKYKLVQYLEKDNGKIDHITYNVVEESDEYEPIECTFFQIYENNKTNALYYRDKKNYKLVTEILEGEEEEVILRSVRHLIWEE